MDVVVTAQMPIGHLGQSSFNLDEWEEPIDIFLLDVSPLAPLGTAGPFAPSQSAAATVVAGLSTGMEAMAPESLQSNSLPATVIVDARAAGAFGAKFGIVDEGALELVKAYVFTRAETVTISVTGKIDLRIKRSKSDRTFEWTRQSVTMNVGSWASVMRWVNWRTTPAAHGEHAHGARVLPHAR